MWIGLDEGAPELAMLADAVQRGDRSRSGYEPDHRDFTAHVTVARSPRARPMASLVHALGDGPVGPVFHVTDVVLMESDTRPGRRRLPRGRDLPARRVTRSRGFIAKMSMRSNSRTRRVLGRGVVAT